ncbi:MAG: Cas10/Cmr2 second palm domain-containing protein [Cyanobacteriota bacterium]|jgi:CRISPR-associated protein Cmr2
MTYTAVTFAPVQGFIEKSRKLRDLYGSSFLLSYLAESICRYAQSQFGENAVISPALTNVTKGTPNQIILRGEYPEADVREVFKAAWGEITQNCREWLEDHCQKYLKVHRAGWNEINLWTSGSVLPWQEDWERWTNHAWELFYATGQTITEVRQNLNEVKRARAWIGINWIGESSTLSGADGVAYPGMSLWTGKGAHQRADWNEGRKQDEVRAFYQTLTGIEGLSAVFDDSEQLSIPELIKRLVTLRGMTEDPNRPMPFSSVVTNIHLRNLPPSFQELNRYQEDGQKTGWFMGDGDKAGDYLKQINDANDPDSEARELHCFSRALREWGEEAFENSLPQNLGRVIYAGGDDFLGVLYRNEEPELKATECLAWFYDFPDVWKQHQQPITVSVGFVWAYPQVPQRDILQHCREAEKSAKSNGRDRLALRIVFNGGNYLEWACPWRFLESIFQGYRDQEGKNNWGHFYSDVAALEARRAFSRDNTDIAEAIFKIYFPSVSLNWDNLESADNREWWNQTIPQTVNHKTVQVLQGGILGDPDSFQSSPDENRRQKINRAVNRWVVNLAKVGFHLCR